MPLHTLKRLLQGMPGYSVARQAYWMIRDTRARAETLLLLRRPSGLFQVSSTTHPNRYPDIFAFVQQELKDNSDRQLLSFGCSSGEEVFSLRSYFPNALIKGIDISKYNIALCYNRLEHVKDDKTVFEVAGSTTSETSATYDAIFCMAVLRHSALRQHRGEYCDHLIRFAEVERLVADLARCLRPGGLLVIQHSNFRFSDMSPAGAFEVALRVPKPPGRSGPPLFGRNNQRLNEAPYDEVVFRKRTGTTSKATQMRSPATPVGVVP